MSVSTFRRRRAQAGKDTWMRVKNPDSLRNWRKQRRFSQQQLATLVRCSQNTISLLELGHMKTCTPEVAVAIAAWLDVPWMELFEAQTHEVVPGDTSSLSANVTPIAHRVTPSHHRKMRA
ncbi:helix-turn-helix transcriptional regulator [Paenarthrobacter nicotinovorans]|uniref:helix-turn-helix transcriptional regulator n=1 Tax=Paenarthrobacter nicotinovorans TaxID=29320 RepID=UPI00249610DE|nr:hypothetical protein [Paenarthrobacter nicotinovorans]